MGSKTLFEHLKKIRRTLYHLSIFTGLQKSLICAVFLLVLAFIANFWVPLALYTIACTLSYAFTCHVSRSSDGVNASWQEQRYGLDRIQTLLRLQTAQELLFDLLYGRKTQLASLKIPIGKGSLLLDESDKNIERNKIVNSCSKLNASDVDKYSNYQSLHSQFHDIESNRKRDNSAEVNLQAEIQQICALVMKDFVLSWYQQVSFGNHGAENAQKLIDQITATAYARIAAIDRFAVISKVIELYMCHLQEFQEATKTFDHQPRFRRRGSVPTAENEFIKVKTIEEVYQNNLKFHVALIGGDNEVEYLRAIVDVLLQRLLSAELYNCVTVKDMFADILICNVIVPLLELLCEPDFLHEKTIQILTDDGDVISEQLLAIKEKLIVYKDGSSLEQSSNSQTAVEKVSIQKSTTTKMEKEGNHTELKDSLRPEKHSEDDSAGASTPNLMVSAKEQESSSKIELGIVPRQAPLKNVSDIIEYESKSKAKQERETIASVSVEGHGADSLRQLSGTGGANQEFVFFPEVLAEHFNIVPVKSIKNDQPEDKNLQGDLRRDSADGLSSDMTGTTQQKKSGTEEGALSFDTIPIIQLQVSTPISKTPPSTSVSKAPGKSRSPSVKSLTKFSSLPRDLDRMAENLDAHSINTAIDKKKSRRQSLHSLTSDEEDAAGLSTLKPFTAPESSRKMSSYEQIDMFEVYQDPGTGQLRVRQRSRAEISPPRVLPPLTEGIATDGHHLDPSEYSTRTFRNSSNASDYLVISSNENTDSSLSPFNSSAGDVSMDSVDGTDMSKIVDSPDDTHAFRGSLVENLASVVTSLEQSLTSVSTLTPETPTISPTSDQVKSSSHIQNTPLQGSEHFYPVQTRVTPDRNFSPKSMPSPMSSPNLVGQSNQVRDYNLPSLPSPSSSPSHSEQSFSPRRTPSLSSSPGSGKMSMEHNSSQAVLSDSSFSPGAGNISYGTTRPALWEQQSQTSRGTSPDPSLPITDEKGPRIDTWIPSLYTALQVPRTEVIQDRGHGSFVVYEVEYLAHYLLEGSSEPEPVPRNVKRRFKEFLILQERLEENPRLRAYLKGIKAPSKWFSLPFGTFDKDGIESRRKFLEKYIQSLLEQKPIVYSGEMREFLAYDSDASLAFVKKATDIPVSWIDKVFNKTKSGMSGVIDKIDQTLTSKPAKTLEEAHPASVVKKPTKREIDVERLPSEDVDALRVQFAVTSEKQKIELGLDRHLLTKLFSPDSFGVEMTESLRFSDDDFQEAYDGDDDDEDVMQSAGDDQLHKNVLSHTILDLACQTTNGCEIALCKEKVLESFQMVIGTFFEKWLKNEIADITSTESISKYLRLLREAVWPERPYEELAKTEEDKDRTKQLARQCLKEFFPALIPLLAGPDNFDHCVEQVLNSVQHPKINRHFFLCLIDLLVEEFLPEVSIKAVQEDILATRGKH
ncbi:uncharacterized protein LOC135503139 [Lineus longissimus]|uniref:uncharacterized protein LOC135503139 n=1 Tax=Lineus longissimus TaxID=88925 RepID=UPI00315C7859